MFGDKVQCEILINQMQQCFNVIPKQHQIDQTIGDSCTEAMVPNHQVMDQED